MRCAVQRSVHHLHKGMEREVPSLTPTCPGVGWGGGGQGVAKGVGVVGKVVGVSLPPPLPH